MESPPERPTCLPAGTYPDLPPDSPMSADGVANRLFGGACHQHREAAEALLSSPLPWNDNTLESVFASGERCLDSRSYAEYFERWRRELYRDIDCSNKAAYTPDFIEHLEAMKEQRQKEEEKGSERAEGHSKRMSEDGKGSSREGAVDAVTGQSTEEDGEGREGGGLASASSSYANIPDALLENQWGLRLMDFVKLARETGATHHQLDQRGNASGRQSQSAFSTHSGGGVQRGSVPRVSVTSSLSPPPFGTRGSLSAASASGGPRGSLDAAPAAAMGRLSIQSFTGQGGRHRSRSRGSSVVSQQGPGFRSHSIASSAGGPSGLFSKYEGPLLQGAVKGYDLNLGKRGSRFAPDAETALQMQEEARKNAPLAQKAWAPGSTALFLNAELTDEDEDLREKQRRETARLQGEKQTKTLSQMPSRFVQTREVDARRLTRQRESKDTEGSKDTLHQLRGSARGSTTSIRSADAGVEADQIHRGSTGSARRSSLLGNPSGVLGLAVSDLEREALEQLDLNIRF